MGHRRGTADIRRSGAVASNNPGSNLRLSSGICRTRDILATGGRVAFGTDGISFSDSEDMFAELRLACYLQRDPRAFDEVRLDSEQVLRAAGDNGARALRQEGRVGALAEGMFADLLVLDTTRLRYPAGRFDQTPVLDLLLDRAHAGDLRSVMIHGRLVLDDGRITMLDEHELREHVAWQVAPRVYQASDEVRRWSELGRLVEPTVLDFYRAGYTLPVEPAQAFNTR